MKFQWRKRKQPDKVEHDLEKELKSLSDLFREEYKLLGYSPCCWMIPENPLINNNEMENLNDYLKGKVIKNVTHNSAGQVTGIEFEVEKISPKRGDFFKVQTTLTTFIVGIFMNYNPNGGFVSYCSMTIGSRLNPMFNLSEHGITTLAEFVPVSESEKQTLLDALAKYGKRWDAENKKVVKLRWRAEYGCKYSRVQIVSGVATVVEKEDYLAEEDNNRYNSGDYFNPKTNDAQTVADRINSIFAENL